MLGFKKRAALIVFLGAVVFSSCKKEKIAVVKQLEPKVQIQNYDRLVKFVSVVKYVTINEVKFDNSKQEFYIPGTLFRASLSETQKYYDLANEYKFKYESN